MLRCGGDCKVQTIHALPDGLFISKYLSDGNETPLCNVSLFVLYATPVTSGVSYMQKQSLLHQLLLPNLQDGHFDRMRELIEHAVQLNSGRQAVLVAHSMGGLVSLYFITRQSPEWRYVVCHSASLLHHSIIGVAVKTTSCLRALLPQHMQL